MVKTSSKGFSLVEILAVITITLIVLGVVVFNYNFGRKSYNLNDTANEFITNLRQVEHWSVVGKDYSGTFPKGGYGIHLSTTNNSSYIIFANNSTSTHQYNTNTQDIETISLHKGIIIQSLTPAPLDIIFQPPWPIVYVNDSTTTPATITLKNTSTNQTTTITINNQGGITF